MMLNMITKSKIHLFGYKKVKRGKPYFMLRSTDQEKKHHTIGELREDDIDQIIDYLNFIKKELSR